MLKRILIDGLICVINSFFELLCFFIWGRNKNIQFNNICVHKEGMLGDTICMTPALYEIRKKYPEAKITLLSTPVVRNGISAKTLLSDEEWLDDIIIYYFDETNPLKKGKIYFRELKRNYHFDCFINLQYEKARIRVNIKNIYWAIQLHVKYATGFKISTLKIFPKTQNRGHFTNEVMRSLNGLFFETGKPIFPFRFSDYDNEYIENLILGKKELLIIAFKGKGTAKSWPIECFREIAKRWTATGRSIAITGGKGDYDEAKLIVKGIEGAFNFCGKTTPKQCMLLVKKSGKVLSVDTGTGHMASAMDAQLISLFSACYFRDKWFPYGNHVKIFYKPEPCSPCLSKECRYGTNKCMKNITIDEVWDEMQKWWIE